MQALAPLDWQAFSRNYLLKENFSPDETLPTVKLSNALLQYLVKEHPEIKISNSSTLRKYAFHKAGREEGTTLTHHAAREVFEQYQEVTRSLKVELVTRRGFQKPPKPIISSGLARCSFLSCSVVEKYIEPPLKDRVQNLLNQVNTIQQVATPFFENEPRLDLQKITSLELMAKKLAYLNPKNGERYQISFGDQMVEYEAEEIHLWMGTYAYGFKPINGGEAPPILVFSGTRLSPSNRGSLATLTADFDPRGVGYIAYANAKKDITKWLQGAGKNALVTGHSLGGALARYTAIDNPEHVQEAITFSAPGISHSYEKKWKALKKDPLKQRPALCNFNHIEDKVPTLGQKNLGRNYQVICAVEKTVNKRIVVQRSIHSKMLFARKVSLLCKVKPKRSFPIWMQRAMTIIPFIFFMTLTILSRVLFGIYTSRPYTSLLGPLRWVWRQVITDKLAAKYAENHTDHQQTISIKDYR